MRSILGILLFGLLTSYLASAQPIRMTDVDQRADVFHASRVLKADGSVTIDALLAHPDQYAFQPLSQNPIQPKTGKSGYWMTVDITNETDAELLLQFIYNGTKLIDVYETWQGAIVARHRLGALHPERTNPVRKSNPFCPLNIRRGETHRIYVYQQGIYTSELPIYCLTATRLLTETHRSDLFYGIFYGIVLAIGLGMLLFSVRVHAHDILMYGIWVLLLGVQTALFRGHLNEFLYARHPAIEAYGAALGGVVGMAHVLFTLSFLRLHKKAPRLYRAALALLILFGVGILWLVVDLNTGTPLDIDVIPLVALAEGVFNIAAGVYVHRRGFRPARYYILGNLGFYALLIVFLLYAFGYLPYSFFTYNSMIFGTTFEIALFATALASSINLLRQQRRQAIQEKIELLQAQERLVSGQNAMLEQQVAQRTLELQEEKQRSEELLLNILPGEIVEELKKSGTTQPRRYEQVTVMFMDIQNFTEAGEQFTPEQLVSELDHYFRSIDAILGRYRIEKIKTIGDAYLCAGGVPVAYPDNAGEVVRAALEIKNFLEQNQLERQVQGQAYFSFRIGIHTGPVVAGVVGARKFAYDIWGDTVNTAARMEQHGEAGKVNISATTYSLVNDRVRCSYRGKVPVKHKGDLDMYFAEAFITDKRPLELSP
ncbi:hypothetical protein GCM10023187_31650 [Nibrella viscosa]|uniref:Guanylate cyclase domain-containing protein n=1 Tax=Nibrella viscosa TaxID=1084524 RepID=A0ABP8KLB1_9BACT